MKVLICGSRNWPDPNVVIDYVNALPNDTVVIEGEADGVDKLARIAATKRGLFVVRVPVEPSHWSKYGRSAGHKRNAVMLALKPDRVVAFHHENSPGTRGTVERARELGIPVDVVDDLTRRRAVA